MLIGAKLWSIADCGVMEGFVSSLEIRGEVPADQMDVPAVVPDPLDAIR